MPDSPLPADALRRHGLAAWAGQILDELNDPRADVLKPDRARTLHWNTVALGLLRQLITGLKSEGINTLPIKGAAFLLRYGPRAYGVRPMSDLDVLVHPKDYRKAQNLLLAMGFERLGSPGDKCTELRANECGLATKRDRAWIPIDLHRRFGAWPTLRSLVPLIASEREAIDGIVLPTPLLMAIIALAHRARALHRHDLRELLDLYHAWQSMDRTATHRYASELRRLGLLQQHCYAVEEVRQHFDPSHLPAAARICEASQTWRASAFPHLQQRLRHQFGYGSALEVGSAMAIYYGARVIDRMVFRRGRNRWRRRAHNSGGCWQSSTSP